MESTTISPHRISAGKLVFGLALVTVGLLAFFDAIDFGTPDRLWRLWPLVLIALGLASEIDALRVRKNEGGGFLLGVGVWFLAGMQHWFGLTVRTAFPLGVVVLGASLVLHAIVDLPETKESKETEEKEDE
jgi:hypothetical protein